MRILATQCAGANPSIMPITMKITKAERMITGNRNLSIFIKGGPPGVFVMVLKNPFAVINGDIVNIIAKGAKGL
jgi:hypothetical protein